MKCWLLVSRYAQHRPLCVSNTTSILAWKSLVHAPDSDWLASVKSQKVTIMWACRNGCCSGPLIAVQASSIILAWNSLVHAPDSDWLSRSKSQWWPSCQHAEMDVAQVPWLLCRPHISCFGLCKCFRCWPVLQSCRSLAPLCLYSLGAHKHSGSPARNNRSHPHWNYIWQDARLVNPLFQAVTR